MSPFLNFGVSSRLKNRDNFNQVKVANTPIQSELEFHRYLGTERSKDDLSVPKWCKWSQVVVLFFNSLCP